MNWRLARETRRGGLESLPRPVGEGWGEGPLELEGRESIPQLSHFFRGRRVPNVLRGCHTPGATRVTDRDLATKAFYADFGARDPHS